VEKYGRNVQAISIATRFMCTACWITKATDTHSEYIIIVADLQQQWLRKRASVLCLHLHCLSCLSCFVLTVGVIIIYESPKPDGIGSLKLTVQAMYVQRNIETRSRNHFCHGKAISIKYSQFVSVFLLQSSRVQIACAVLYCHLWPVWLYHTCIFPHYVEGPKNSRNC